MINVKEITEWMTAFMVVIYHCGMEMTEIGTTSFEPSRMMDPLPNCFSSPERASSIALLRSSATIYLSYVGKNGGLATIADSSTQNGKSK